MSYILDALKKLEREKSRKSRGDGMVNISGTLFEHDRPQPTGTAGWKIALAVTIAVLVTFGATWFLLRPAPVRVTAVSRLTAPVSPTPSVPPVAVEPAPLPAVPAVVPVQQAPPAAPAQPPPVRPPVAPAAPQKAVVPAAPASEDDDDEGRASRRRTKERHVQTLPAAQSMAAPSDIKLSGIAWQDARRARRAVINGFLMQEGGLVSGARITDIFQDRVRFSQSGKSFEIPLISSPVPAAGK